MDETVVPPLISRISSTVPDRAGKVPVRDQR